MSTPVENMYRAVEFIEAHLQSEINIAQVADAVGYSLFHFIRTFDRVVHHTPYDYLIRRRLTEAASALAASDRRIIDISQDFCFNNHETFTRAFKRLFHVQPSEWREKKLATSTLLMPPKTMDDLRYVSEEFFRYPEVVELSESPLYGLMTPLDVDNPVQQYQRSQAIVNLRSVLVDIIPDHWVGVTLYLDPGRRNAYYFIGVEKTGWQPGLPRLAEYTLQAGRYARIFAPGAGSRTALKYMYYTWFPRVGLQPVGDIEVEWIAADSKGDNTIYIPLPQPKPVAF